MHANQDARLEAQRYYQKVDFTTDASNRTADSQFNACDTIMTRYNPGVNVILFNEQTCMDTIVRFFEDQHRHSVDITHVAILMPGNVISCRGCDWNGMVTGGVKGLKEVFFIVPSYLMEVPTGTVDESLWFRPAICEVSDNSNADLDGEPRDEPEPNDVWSGGNEPEFHFISFSPIPTIGKTFGTITIPLKGIPKFNYNSWAFIKNVEYQSGYHIKIPKKDFPQQSGREIGFYRKPEQDSLRGKTWGQKYDLKKAGYHGLGKLDHQFSSKTNTVAASEYRLLDLSILNLLLLDLIRLVIGD
ncbi:uncharacterized protein PAC_12107 [Phialocephala subalpina]|uniref:Uncharacterized protein n=1 Tax=Phialocephala subalpina TaxID=576137 RepID=A0A1L7XAZ4_9HELO|nr:uncharacterized protein PAC_12107 [Phialocephala subalpina]